MGGKTSKGVFYGWWVVIACSFVYGFVAIIHYTTSIFFPFIVEEMGWTRATLGNVFSVYLWLMLLFGLLSGLMLDRIGARKTIMIGSIIGAVGIILLSTIRTVNEVLIYYGVIIALAVALQFQIPTQTTARMWFVKKAGTMAGLIIAAFGVISAAGFPLLTSLAAAYGWRVVALWTGLAIEIAVFLLALLVIRDKPENLGLYPDGEIFPSTALPADRVSPCPQRAFKDYTLTEAMRTPQFWIIPFTFGFPSMVISAFLGHLTSIGVGIGATAAVAGTFMTAWALPSIIGRIGGGLLADRIGKRQVFIITQLAMVFLMLYGWAAVYNIFSLYIFSALAGLLMIVPAVVITPLLGDLFGRSNLGTIGGVELMFIGAIVGFGPMLWGYVATSTGSYNLAMLYMSAGYVLTVVLMPFIRPTRVEKALMPVEKSNLC